MKKKIILKLLLLVVFSISLYSCIHDDISSSDSNSKEYTNRSVWKEDETYIKNVMKVYEENESEIKKLNGTPLWDYAMTMGHTDESFLIVPVANGKKIVSCIQVPRNGDQIRFIYDNDQQHIKFFQGYTTLEKRKAVKMETLNSQAGKPPLADCPISSVSMWYPDNEAEPNGSGHWETNYIITCPPEPIGGSGGSGGDNPTYPYPGGGGSNPQPPKNPCEKLKEQKTNEDFKNQVSSLDKPEIFKKKQETGFAVAYGPKTNYEPLANTDNDNLKLPLGTKYFGFIHVHLDKEGVVKIFSPADITTFLTGSVRNAQQQGSMTDAYAMVITSQGNYILKYSGDGSFGIGPNQTSDWQTWYEKEYGNLKEGELSNPSIVEKIFTQFLEEKVKVPGLEIYKADKTTGNTSKLKYDGKDKPVNSTPCP